MIVVGLEVGKFKVVRLAWNALRILKTDVVDATVFHRRTVTIIIDHLVE